MLALLSLSSFFASSILLFIKYSFGEMENFSVNFLVKYSVVTYKFFAIEIGYLIGDHTRIIGCDFYERKTRDIFVACFLS